MSVHVGEVHTDVIPAGSRGQPGTTSGGSTSTSDLEERLFEMFRRQDGRERRVAAEGFDD